MKSAWDPKIHRRTFLKLCVTSGASITAGCAALGGIDGPGLEQRMKEGTISVPTSWKTDNIIPLPKDKILIGSNVQPRNVEITPWRKEGAAHMMYLNDFKREFRLLPAFSAYGIGKYGLYNDWFFDEKHDTLNRHGVIPVVRYETRPFDGFKEISKGKHDDTFKKLAQAIAKNGVPYVMIPYQLPNEGSSLNWKHGGETGNRYIDAYVHMHEIFGNEGANENTIWSIKLRLGNWQKTNYKNPFSYIPPSEYIDWIGWSMNNHNLPHVGLENKSFEQIMGNKHDKSAILYPDKPQFLWELSTRSSKDQHKWLDHALTTIPTNYPWIRGVVFDVMKYWSNKGSAYHFDPKFTDESKQVIKDHLASGKFTGAYEDGSITIQKKQKRSNVNFL